MDSDSYRWWKIRNRGWETGILHLFQYALRYLHAPPVKKKWIYPRRGSIDRKCGMFAGFYHEAWHLFLDTYRTPFWRHTISQIHPNVYTKLYQKCPFQDWTLWICNYLLILILCFSNIPTMFVQKTSQGFRNPIKKKTCRFALFCIWKRWWPSCCISQYKNCAVSLCRNLRCLNWGMVGFGTWESEVF